MRPEWVGPFEGKHFTLSILLFISWQALRAGLGPWAGSSCSHGAGDTQDALGASDILADMEQGPFCPYLLMQRVSLSNPYQES